MEILKQFGTPQILCRTEGSRPAWGVHRPSGLFIVAHFDADNLVEAIAPSLLLSLWRPVTPESPDDQEGRFFASALIARHGYYD